MEFSVPATDCDKFVVYRDIKIHNSYLYNITKPQRGKLSNSILQNLRYLCFSSVNFVNCSYKHNLTFHGWATNLLANFFLYSFSTKVSSPVRIFKFFIILKTFFFPFFIICAHFEGDAKQHCCWGTKTNTVQTCNAPSKGRSTGKGRDRVSRGTVKWKHKQKRAEKNMRKKMLKMCACETKATTTTRAKQRLNKTLTFFVSLVKFANFFVWLKMLQSENCQSARERKRDMRRRAAKQSMVRKHELKIYFKHFIDFCF